MSSANRGGEGGGVALGVCQLGGGDGQLVVLARVEVVELGGPVQDVGDQLAEENPGRDADLAAQFARDRGCQVRDVAVVDEGLDPGAGGSVAS
jgi:hypothetical protein